MTEIIAVEKNVRLELTSGGDRVDVCVEHELDTHTSTFCFEFGRAEFLAAIEQELGVIVIDRADLPKLVWDENGKLDTGCEWAGSFDLRYWRVTALDALAALRYHEWRTSPEQLALTEALDTANIEAHPDEIKKLIELGVRVSSDE